MENEYYLGLDVGTNSVGYAVTDSEYNLLKFKGEPMWGAHVFETANTCAERRMMRTGRRRLHRRQQRVKLVQEIFAQEIAKVDPRFFIRIQGSTLLREDVPTSDANLLFNDAKYHDKDYHEAYPTIHHLLCDLMESDQPHDVRLVYLAVAWLVAHRGHFFNEVDKDNIEAVLNFHEIYQELQEFMESNGLERWHCEENDFKAVLLDKLSVSDKEKAFQKVVFAGKKFVADFESNIDQKGFLKLLSGGTIKAEKIFIQKDYAENVSLCFRDKEDVFLSNISMLGDEAEWIFILRKIYDWALLKEALDLGKSKPNDTVSISKAKIEIYSQHREDLKNLKYFVKKYIPEQYNRIFRRMDDKGKEKNYVSYSYHLKGIKGSLPNSKANKIEFCGFLKNKIKDIVCEEKDKAFYIDMMGRLQQYTFLPKQVNGDNRVIPYQLYYYELKIILQNAVRYLPFLNAKAEGELTNLEKLLSVFTFKIPYFVGPLRKDNSVFSWIEKKADGKIYPWNFKDKVDFDGSEKAFIDRMKNDCTYLPGERVLSQGTMLYERFMVLNEINNIRLNGAPISVKAKQGIYSLFERKKKVTNKAICDYLKSNGVMESTDVISGIDSTIHSELRSYHAFFSLLERKILTTEQVEKIIEQATYSEDRKRMQQWLENNFSQLSLEDRKYISKLKYQNFGRLSGKFLCGLKGVNKDTGETMEILGFLWITNDNLMQILSDRYTFKEQLEMYQKEYYKEKGAGLDDVMDEMHVSNAVRRPIYRTLDIVKDVCKAMKHPPVKVFVEMARGGGEKGKRTMSRRSQIENLYKILKTDFTQEIRELSQLLEGKTDNELQSEVLFLYFIQLGKSMYSGVPIEIEKLKNKEIYNVDHIYPRCVVKDDSLDNKVLVTSKENGDKADTYPVRGDIREKMSELWQVYRKHGLISEKKYNRLMRCTPFSADEKMGFINRQLVETRQSNKVIAMVLQSLYPDTKIVYVKAGLAADFRHEYDIVKSRLVNDLHHAKDAFLNIVVGNVYLGRFDRRWFNPEQVYSLKTKTLFGNFVKEGKK